MEEKTPLIQKNGTEALPSEEPNRSGYQAIDILNGPSVDQSGSYEDDNGLEIDVETNETGEVLFHCHAREPDAMVDWQARKALIIASIICLCFMVAEIAIDILNGPSVDQSGSYEDDNGLEIDVETNETGEVLFHCHAREPDAMVDWQARKALFIASIICLCFMVAEIVGGLLANSLAIATDAAHLLTDFASFLISLFSLYVASRPATKKMSFGWHRAEVLGAFVSVLLIWIVTGVLVYMAVERIIQKTYEVNGMIMLITAAFGVTVNIIMGTLLGTSGHGHSHGGGGSKGHGHSHKGDQGHSHTNGKSHEKDPEDKHGQASDTGKDVKGKDGKKKNKKSGQNINVRAAFIHVLGDFFQSVGVLIAALIIYFRPDLAIMDPICTFIFSVLVLITTLAIMRDALNVLMEGIPRGVDLNQVATSLESIEGVRMVHNLRIWALTMDKYLFSAHLAIAPDVKAQPILRKANILLRENYGVFESTIQIERYSDAMDSCTKCETPQK